ncbi:MAG: FtsQ-type POTRA domain-containing protein [Nannocystis sp.]|uniref:cell division protein FtsQ/DivIB n=1 Tax=Nannocystis sp. TaxID=1962667 RepID=UPI002427A697|nr:FtsQ-type POTRA domain-containing protein [Nannocystis sp.]MBK9757802.1 FtsQ-type POTRA domain-containing protein [Nannocystis sp.]
MIGPSKLRDARQAAPPKNRRVQQVKPRVTPPTATPPARKPAARNLRSELRPNRRIGAPRPALPAPPRPSRLRPLLRALARPQLGPRTRRFLSAGMRLGVAVALAWGLLLGVQQGYQYVTTSARFEAKTIAFQPTPHLSADRLAELMALAPGTNILAVDVDAVRRSIEADPWVATATVSRELPDTLHVAVAEHTPAAVLHSGHFYLLDDAGVPFKRIAPGERGSLPVITGVERDLLVKGDPAAAQIIRRALDVLAAYDAKARPRLGEIHIGDGGEALLYTEKTGTLLRLGRGPIAERLARFDALRAALGERADKLSVVHLDAAPGGDRPARVVASFTDAAEAEALLAQASLKPKHKPAQQQAAQDLEDMSAKPAAKPAAPAKQPKQPKQPKHKKQPKGQQGPHKFPSGIPKYD